MTDLTMTGDDDVGLNWVRDKLQAHWPELIVYIRCAAHRSQLVFRVPNTTWEGICTLTDTDVDWQQVYFDIWQKIVEEWGS